MAALSIIRRCFVFFFLIEAFTLRRRLVSHEKVLFAGDGGYVQLGRLRLVADDVMVSC